MNIPYLLFKKVTNNFSDDRVIGRGGFGNVYKGYLDNGELIAVKMLHPLQGLDDGLFKNEVCNNLFHPNIVGLLGYCDEIHSEFVEHKGEKVSSKHVYRGLCFEYFPNGSLHKHLDEQSLAPNWSTRYNIIKGICQGLNFLHGCKPPIFHLDLKPDNILMDNSMVPKLADFGLSRLFHESHSQVTQQRIGTDKYMPQEYRNGGKISEKYDVFSLGVIMIEIMEGYSLFQEMDDVTQIKQEVLVKWSSMIEPTAKYRPQLLLQVKTCIDMAMRCVDSERKNRPTIATILATLDETETQLPSKQLAVQDLSLTSNIRNSLAETLRMMKSELDSIKISVTNMEQVPEIREAPSNVEEPFIIEEIGDRETSSYVEEGLIIGRTEERKKILSILSESSTKEMVILPIYGIGGIGKTTLAQLVYSDTQFSGYSQVWVYVSEHLDLHKIGNSIISQLSKGDSNIANMQIIQNRLRELFADKRILIVLDDLWEDKPHELDKLKAMLSLGKGRKVIIVTTRDEAIARKISSTVKYVPYKLEILTDDMCWAIIKQKSEFENQADKNILEQIGREIAVKCGGVALAAQSLGYMLRYMTSDQWESVRDSDIWNLSTSEDPSVTTHEVLSSLWLSYSHMHKFLKLCFCYCAVFPKGHLIAKYDLIHQWIALEFKPSGMFDSMQVCEQYFRQLLGMSFLQHATTPLDEYTTLFTMHDLVHDLARAADKINKNGSVVGSSNQYALVTDPSKPLSSPENIKALHLECKDKKELPDGIFSPAKNLRVLDISNCPNQKLPNSIDILKQLRYLRAKWIPDGRITEGINKLTKLNYLNLCGSSMNALPDSIGDMKGLMHLDLSNCKSLSKLPVSFVNLRQLVYLDLSSCSVPMSESWGGFTKLQYLNLSWCDYMSPAPEVLPEVLSKLTKLQYLNLSIFTRFHQIKVLPDLDVFSKLTKLRYLNLAGCLVSMSEADIHGLLVGISTLYNLEHLHLSDNVQLKSIPESIGNLTKLCTLDLSGCYIQNFPACMAKMVSLKSVNMTEFEGSAFPLLPFAPLPHFVVHVYPGERRSNLILLAPTNPGHLRISKLENVTSLEEAQSIKLIEKRGMHHLKLEWTVDCDTRFVDDSDVLEKLVPPNTVSILDIIGYSSSRFPANWPMEQYLPLEFIDLVHFPKCNNIQALGRLPKLYRLVLSHMDSLEDWNTADYSSELMFPKLDTLIIESCPRLRMKPCLPRAMKTLVIEASDNMLISWTKSVSQTRASSSSSVLAYLSVTGSTVPLHQWRFLQHVSALRKLCIIDCRDLTSYSPEIIQRLSSIEKLLHLKVKDNILTELPTWLFELTHLQRLSIILPAVEKLNDNTRKLTSLEELTLKDCRSMVSLPQWLGELTSLKKLHIIHCEGIWSLPGSIRQLTKLFYICFEYHHIKLPDIQKMFSSIPADTDEINIREYLDSLQSDLDSLQSEDTEEDIEEDEDYLYNSCSDFEVGILEDEEDLEEHEDYIDKFTDSEEGIEEYEEDIEEHDDTFYEFTDSEEHEEDMYEFIDSEEEIGEHEEDIAKTFLGTTRNLDTAGGSRINISGTSAGAAAVGDAKAVALVPSVSDLYIESGSTKKNLSDPPSNAVSHSTHQNMLHKRRAGVRRTWTRRPRQLYSGASLSGSMIDNSAAHALIRPDEVDSKVFVTPFSAISIESATKILSDPPADLVSTSTHDNVAHKHDVGVMHTSTHEIRLPPQLLPAASATTTSSPDTSSGSKINKGVSDALIPTDEVDAKDLVSSFSKISIDSGFTLSATKRLTDVLKTSTQQNVDDKHRAGVRHTWTRQLRQCIAATSADTTNSLDTANGSTININSGAADAVIIPTNVMADAADTSVEDIIRSFFALSNEPGSATWLDM